jgi:hypothetical protein
MALELILQCQPILKLMLEQAQAVQVCPGSSEFEQAQGKHIETTHEFQTEREQVIDKTYLSNMTEISTCAESSVDDTVRTMKYSACDVTDKDVVCSSKSGLVDSLEGEVTLKEHVMSSGCDNRERCGKEVRPSSGSGVCQDRNESEEELAERKEQSSLVQLLEQRLQFVLRSLTKLCLSKSGSSKKDKE